MRAQTVCDDADILPFITLKEPQPRGNKAQHFKSIGISKVRMAYSSFFFHRLKIFAYWKEFTRKVARRLGRDMDKAVGDTTYAPIPKIIWMYWHQGWDQAPDLAKRCRQSWEEKNPGWTVHALDQNTVKQYAPAFSFPPNMPVFARADLLRLQLLAKNGGVWADATLLCQTPLDHWLPMAANGGFFVFHRPFRDRLISNWFIASTPGNLLSTAWRDAMAQFWLKPGARVYVYLVAHYMFETLVRGDRKLQTLWNQMPKISARPAHIAQSYLKGLVTADQVVALMDTASSPVHKLSHKTKSSLAQIAWIFELSNTQTTSKTKDAGIKLTPPNIA